LFGNDGSHVGSFKKRAPATKNVFSPSETHAHAAVHEPRRSEVRLRRLAGDDAPARQVLAGEKDLDRGPIAYAACASSVVNPGSRSPWAVAIGR